MRRLSLSLPDTFEQDSCRFPTVRREQVCMGKSERERESDRIDESTIGSKTRRESFKIKKVTMAVSAAPPVLSPNSTPGSGGLFCSEPMYSRPTENTRLTNSMINTFIATGGGGGGGGGGNGNGAGVNNDCKMVEVHGVKVASFSMDGQELICLPQVFDLFLKHLVGGLHTVYTKLKRLDICPVVCTVEQVRILRGLGAIQPGGESLQTHQSKGLRGALQRLHQCQLPARPPA
ncbi:hypothetical protein SKAU_G00367680 [Synaphobranchus kaupii]|uniref:SKI/SNO/DAC domain-containing protein n=1 Tax=Synaphobranchus kaupii TaxID=118154 RepID=A0A9Q1IFH3_SYNKA|nr:hypothetical protein SKAU_G00367680 [Synaphobranchus kaupii]